MLDLGDFHIVRPWFLLAIPLGLIALWWITRQTDRDQRLIDPLLQQFMIVTSGKTKHYAYRTIYTICIVIFGLALSGPGWKTIEIPSERTINPTWVLFDLSWSMAAEDLQPSRYSRAAFAINDLLSNSPQNAPYSLIAFAGEAFQVVPMSYDLAALQNFLTALSPEIMPSDGSNPLAALLLVDTLTKQASSTPQQQENTPVTVVLVSDDLRQQQSEVIHFIRQKNWRIALIAAGKDTTAPIRLADGNLLRSTNNEIAFASYNPRSFQNIADAVGGRFASVDGVFGNITQMLRGWGSQSRKTDENQMQKADQGYILLLLLVPLVLMLARRGVLFSLLLVAYIGWLGSPHTAWAISWQDLWIHNENQAIELLKAGQYDTALAKTDNTLIEGAAYYRKKQWQQAIDSFGKSTTAIGSYNAGNAAFQMQDYQQAIDWYQQASTHQPDVQLAKKIADNLALAKQQLAEQRASEQQSTNTQNQQQGDQNQQSNSQANNQSNGKQNSQHSSNNNQQSENNQRGNTQQSNSANQQDDTQSTPNEQHNTEQGNQAKEDKETIADLPQHNQTQTNNQTTADTTKDEHSQNPLVMQQNDNQQRADETGDNQQTMTPVPAPTTSLELDENDTRNQLLKNSVEDNPQELLRRIFWLEHQLRGGKNTNSQSPQL